MQWCGAIAWGLPALMVPLVAGAAVAHPVPAAAPTRWELIFEPGHLRLHRDEVDGQLYWYFNYKVTNRTGGEQVWAPSFTLMTDAGEIVASGRGVPTGVTDELRRLLGNPFLETQNEIIGEIYHGRENAKDGLVIWPAGNLEVNELSLFIAGLSGETAIVRHPLTGEELLLRKTLKRDYLIPGEAVPRGSKPIGLLRQSWVMR